ncbi:MAG: type I glyceraldehyde-3-phosphate dehydrogenase [Bdellovibrionales bacterium]|nr:type I glyceraldehyde-3-phosphate dehydrogenase [Bdellovibrionales bacterium]
MKKEKLKIAINGLGRIGRLLFRYAFKEFDIVLINATSSAEDISYFLKYDSIHGIWDLPFTSQNQILKSQNQEIFCFQQKHPDLIPWDKHKVDIVFECTGKFKDKKDWDKAFSKGVQKVLVSAPCLMADFTLVYGVNHRQYEKSKHHFISNASCTTNCLAPLISVLKDLCGLERVFFSTVHSYTNDQKLLDASHKDLRRSRSAGLNIIPTNTGAGKMLSLIFPELKDKFYGLAYRVPTGNVSLVDLLVETKHKISLEEVKSTFKRKSDKDLKGILGYESLPLVSSDFTGRKESSILDESLFELKNQKYLKLVSWYDNEAGFTQRMLDFAKEALSKKS